MLCMLTLRQVRTCLPVFEEAFESGRKERSISLLDGLRDGPLGSARLAPRILASHLFHQAMDLDMQWDIAKVSPHIEKDAQYRVLQEEIENSLMALLVRLPACLRLP